MSRDSDVMLYVNLLTLLNSTYNVKSLSRDITSPPQLYQNSLQPTNTVLRIYEVLVSRCMYTYIILYK